MFDLCRLPLLLLAHVAHPLVARGNGITRGNGKQRLPEPAGELLPPGSLTDFPSVSLPVHCRSTASPSASLPCSATASAVPLWPCSATTP